MKIVLKGSEGQPDDKYASCPTDISIICETYDDHKLIRLESTSAVMWINLPHLIDATRLVADYPYSYKDALEV